MCNCGNKEFKDAVFFAKVNESAIIPTKRDEDAGYDIYANFDNEELFLKKGKPTMVPTGIASAMSSKYFLNIKRERSSTGKYGMSVLSGCIDSGFRNEILVNICPLYKDVIISKIFNFPVVDGKIKPVETPNEIYYPYSLAIAQGTIEFVPDVEIIEISYDELKEMQSERGMGMFGDSGK